MSPIEQAAEILRRGGVVAFPTETVYGLGADATNRAAIQRVYDIKGRPPTNPLIVHVADADAAAACVVQWTDDAARLAGAFWPGPLTLILDRNQRISPLATAGGPTVAIRVPDHPLALELLRRAQIPVAAPSANRSTRVSPTTAEHVREELGDDVDLILDAGPCRVGLESTVLDLTVEPPMVLRPGSVLASQIATALGRTVMVRSRSVGEGERQSSPGQQAVHYAPRTPAFRFDPRDRPRLDLTNAAVIHMTLDPATSAARLYSMLRQLDREGLDAIYVEMPPEGEEWLAIRDRITRATRPWTDRAE